MYALRVKVCKEINELYIMTYKNNVKSLEDENERITY